MTSVRRVLLRAGPDDDEGSAMEFRLTYEGALYAASNSGSKRPKHKHEIRRVFHKQLKSFWAGHPFLRQAIVTDPQYGNRDPTKRKLLKDELADKYERSGYNFVPLVTPDLTVSCRLDILCLRPEGPGQILQSGDHLIRCVSPRTRRS